MTLPRQHHRSSEQGYILLVLLLAVTVLSIMSLAAVQTIEFQIKRYREEEMIHRGVQYSRAVRHFYKKFSRYPTSIAELENTNNVRFLRRRYKDPMNRDPKTGKERDFRLLHMQDLQSLSNPSVRGMNSVSDIAAQQGAPGALNGSASAPVGAGPSAIASNDNSQTSDQAGEAQSDQSPDNSSDSATQAGAAPQPLAQQMGANGPQVFGGGAIVGVASYSKEKSIREFNKKNHYNQWQFIYDPSTDRGGLLMTPNQPPLMSAGQANTPQQNGINGTAGQGFGNGMNPSPNGSNQSPVNPPAMPPDQQQQ